MTANFKRTIAANNKQQTQNPIAFDFSWDDCSTLEKLQTMGGGGNNVHYGLCEIGQWLNGAGYLTFFCFCVVNRFSEQISYSQHLFLVRTRIIKST